MKSSIRPGIIATIASLPLLCATAQAQFLPPRAPWGSASVDTIGGVTYFTFGGKLPNCHWIETGETISVGQSFSLPVWEMVGDICLDCLDCYNLQTNSIVLGKLAPGNYALQATYSEFPGIPQPGDPVIYQKTFTVPDATQPTLSFVRTGSTMEISVTTATAAEVTVYTSADLRRWTPLPQANPILGPHIFNVGTTNQLQFLRASLASGSMLHTVFGGGGLPASNRP